MSVNNKEVYYLQQSIRWLTDEQRSLGGAFGGVPRVPWCVDEEAFVEAGHRPGDAGVGGRIGRQTWPR